MFLLALWEREHPVEAKHQRRYLLDISIVVSQVHCKKGERVSRPHPGCHLPNSPWPEKLNYSHARESYIPAGDGKTAHLFYSELTALIHLR